MEGLSYIHTHNIIHGNLTPQNIVFNERGQPKIIDFRLATLWSKHNSHLSSGTPGYIGIYIYIYIYIR